MKHFDVTYKSNTISAILRYAEEYVEILCSNKRVQSSDTEEQTAVLMESVVDALELSFAEEIDEDTKLTEASALLMKAMQVTAMLKRAPSEEQKLMNDYLQTKAREVVECDPFKFDWNKLKDNMQQMLRTNKSLSNPWHLDKHEKEFLDCKKVTVGKRKVFVPKGMGEKELKKLKVAMAGVLPTKVGKKPKNERKCDWCGKDGHSEDWCAYNPDNNCPHLNEKLKKLSGTKPRGFYKSEVRASVLTLDEVEDEPTEVQIDMFHSDVGEDMQVDYDDDLGKVTLLNSYTNTLPPVLADGGSTHNVFNHDHRMLFIQYRSIKPMVISGIGGETPLSVIGRAKVCFMDSIIDALYAPEIVQSVLSEGNLTEKHGFSIHKVGRVVRFVSKTHRTLTTYLHQNRPTIQVEKNFRYNKIQSYCTKLKPKIVLASVRPSDACTLWHGRFGHFNMRTIICCRNL